MNHKQRLELIRHFFETKCIPTLEAKGHDYTNGTIKDDPNANFKIVGDMLHMSPLMTWAVYFMKHITAIITFVNGTDLKSESINERILDAINYLFILYTMLEDESTIAKAKGIDISTMGGE